MTKTTIHFRRERWHPPVTVHDAEVDFTNRDLVVVRSDVVSVVAFAPAVRHVLTFTYKEHA